MSITSQNISKSIAPSRYLPLLVLSYSVLVMMSNWYDSRLIMILGVTMTPGALVYSLTFLISNIITEVYGFKYNRLAIFYALIFNLFFVAYGWMIMYIPSADITNYQVKFDDFLITNTRIISASFVGYLISEPTNSYLVSRMKIYFNGRFIGVRFLLSTFTAGLIDTVLFMIVAFYGTMPNDSLLSLIIHVWFVKALIELVFIPLSIKISKKLKTLEQLDIYDIGTKFTPFSLDTEYDRNNNKFNLKNKENL